MQIKPISLKTDKRGLLSLVYEQEHVFPGEEDMGWLKMPTNSVEPSGALSDLIESLAKLFVSRMQLAIDPMNVEFEGLKWSYPKDGAEVSFSFSVLFDRVRDPVKMQMSGIQLGGSEGGNVFATIEEMRLLSSIFSEAKKCSDNAEKERRKAPKQLSLLALPDLKSIKEEVPELEAVEVGLA